MFKYIMGLPLGSVIMSYISQENNISVILRTCKDFKRIKITSLICLGNIMNIDLSYLKYIKSDSFNGSLELLRGAPLTSFNMFRFNGSLEPLRGAPLTNIDMYNFNGSLEPLRGAPL